MTSTLTRPSTAPPRPRRERSPERTGATRWQWCAAVVAAVAIAIYLYVALRRVAYPYALEWMEGGVLTHVQRVRDGAPLYSAPSIGFVPYLYTPLYYVVGALATVVLGVGLPALRAVSLVSSLVLFAGIGVLASRDARRAPTAIVAAGLFAACFALGGAWLDLAREDTLCLAILAWGLVAARRARGGRTALVAALLLTLAFLTKQLALLPALAVAPYLLARVGRRVAAIYAAALALGIGGTTLVLNLVTHGWYVRYAFVLPAKHDLVSSQYIGFFTGDLAKPAAVLVALAFVGVVVLARRGGDAIWFHAVVGAGLVLAAYLGRLHSGGYDNVVLPAYMELAIVAALGLERLLEADRAAWQRGIVSLLVGGQLAALAYSPARLIPSAADARAGDRVIAALRALPQPVYVPTNPWYAEQAGSPLTAQSAAIEDVLRAHVDGTDVALATQLHDAIAAHRFGAIVVDSASGLSYLPKDLCAYYRPDHALPVSGDDLFPVTGTRTRPAEVWLPVVGAADPGCTPP